MSDNCYDLSLEVGYLRRIVSVSVNVSGGTIQKKSVVI
jgi:hypothetical protein